MSAPDVFGGAMRRDPAIALVPPVVEPLRPGPAHHAQYVVELVGPRSIPAAAAGRLLAADWYQALGQPELFAMAPADNCWRPLSASGSGSYDSLALCWDIVASKGSLSSGSGAHLLQVAEQFASTINRRAMPLPPPADLERTVRNLEKVRNGLDVGVVLLAIPPAGDYVERAIWVLCARLGLEFGSAGGFEWRSPDHPQALFEVTPMGDVQTFSLRAVQAGATHPGVTIGFSVPRCPAPAAALDGALHAANAFARELGGAVFEEDGKPLTPRASDSMRRNLQMAVEALEKAGLRPGSSAALKVFPPQ